MQFHGETEGHDGSGVQLELFFRGFGLLASIASIRATISDAGTFSAAANFTSVRMVGLQTPRSTMLT